MPVMDAEHTAALTIARAEGRGQAIRLATQAVCPRCARGTPPYGPAVLVGDEPGEPGEWQHSSRVDWPCKAAPIWEAIKAEGWS